MVDKQLKGKAINIKGKNYVLVSDRVLYFNEAYTNGAIESEYTLDNDTYHFKAIIVPDVDNPSRRFIGHSQAIIGDGMVNKTAAMENAETSAVGRALAMMGIGVIESIASADEMKKATNVINSSQNIKFATEKQIAWMRDEAMRQTGLELREDVDEWIKEILTIYPKQVPLSKVKAAVDKIKQAGEEEKPVQNPDVVITDIPENITLDDVPY